MTCNILILGASYGSLLGSKLAMAGHNVTMTCRAPTAALINAKGTEVRIKLRDEDNHRAIRSGDLSGTVRAITPDQATPDDYDMIALAMQEPQYRATEVAALMARIAASGKPCLSIMNMPPLPFLARIPGVDVSTLRGAFSCPEVWDGFAPGAMSLCSPDPQAFRPPEDGANVLHVGLPTNFKAARFADAGHNAMLETLASDIAAVRLNGKDVPVKLRVYASLFVPLAKWSMLLTGNYRCVMTHGVQPIREAVQGDLAISASIYAHVDRIARHLGADAADQVPFEKYASAANGLQKPSSVARSIDGGAGAVERVDLLVKLIGDQIGMANPLIDRVAATTDARLTKNRRVAA